MGESNRYEVVKIKGLVEKALTKGKESESALIQLSQIDYVSCETLADVIETVQKYKGMYNVANKKNKKYSKIIKDLIEE